MADAIFAHPRLAPIYDAFDGPRDDPAAASLEVARSKDASNEVITLRFRGREELESSLSAQGYRALEVREAPDRPGHEFVFITQRTV